MRLRHQELNLLRVHEVVEQRICLHFLEQLAAHGKQFTLIDYMSKNPRYCNLREQKGKRSMVVKTVETVETAVGLSLIHI